MKNNLSLFELEEIENRLKKWIKSDEDFLDEFKTYFIKEGKISFLMSGKYVSKNVNISNTINRIECTLEDYRDINTGKPLTENTKRNIKLIIDKLEREKKRLFEINERKFKLIAGEDFFKEEGNSNQVKLKKENTNKVKNTKYKEEELVKFYIKTSIKLKSIPLYKDLEKFASKSTWSRSLNDKDFIIRLVHRIQEDKKAKYHYADDRIEIIDELENYFNARLSALTLNEQKKNKHINSIEYNDNIHSLDESDDENYFN